VSLDAETQRLIRTLAKAAPRFTDQKVTELRRILRPHDPVRQTAFLRASGRLGHRAAA